MTYDSEVLEVWLDELAPEPGPVQEVCDFHAGRLTAPRDWTVSDRRAPRPADELLPSGRPPATVAATPAAAPLPAPAGELAGAQAADPAPDLATGSAADPATAPAPSAAPSPDAPTGSLLARAFRSTGRRTGAPAEDPT